MQPVPCPRILQHLPDQIAVPRTAQRVVVVQHGKDFCVFLRCLDGCLHAILGIDAMHAARVHNAVEMHRKQRRRPHQVPIGRDHVQPVRKQHVDLVNVRLQRRVAGFVVLIERRPQPLALIQHHVGRMQLRLAPRRPRRRLLRQLRLPFLQCLHVFLLRRQQQFRQVLPGKNAEGENRQHHRQHHDRHVRQPPENLPSQLSWIVKNLLHSGCFNPTILPTRSPARHQPATRSPLPAFR